MRPLPPPRPHRPPRFRPRRRATRQGQPGGVISAGSGGDIFRGQVSRDPAEILARMAAASDAGEALGSYNPPHPGYRALRAKLAEARTRRGDTGPVRIGAGPVLKPGMRDSRVSSLRHRLGISGDGNETYDKPLAAAVKKFHRH